MNKETLEFVNKHAVGMVATCDDNKPHAVPVYYYYEEEEGVFYFVTRSSTKKYSNLDKNSNVFLTIFDESPQAVFTAECQAETLDCKEDDCIPVTNRLVEVHTNQSYYPSPVEMLEGGSLALIKLTVQKHTFNSYRKGV